MNGPHPDLGMPNHQQGGGWGGRGGGPRDFGQQQGRGGDFNGGGRHPGGRGFGPRDFGQQGRGGGFNGGRGNWGGRGRF